MLWCVCHTEHSASASVVEMVPESKLQSQGSQEWEGHLHGGFLFRQQFLLPESHFGVELPASDTHRFGAAE